MVSPEQIQALKARGELVLTLATFRRSVKIYNAPPRYEYRGKRYYYTDYLLTYTLKQYVRLHNNHAEIPRHARASQGES